ncbi:hypothetical protein SBA4_6330017 [Candidatus Sulfopaludibacter sp. SbA4]|nr:hypothetical protein SBA4_6330017 [Candidatus Sulfopaludibacter sp. SbA4]
MDRPPGGNPFALMQAHGGPFAGQPGRISGRSEVGEWRAASVQDYLWPPTHCPDCGARVLNRAS